MERKGGDERSRWRWVAFREGEEGEGWDGNGERGMEL